MCTPLFVSVDFIRMKKDRSRELSGDRRLGLLDSTGEDKRHKDIWFYCYTLNNPEKFNQCNSVHFKIFFYTNLSS